MRVLNVVATLAWRNLWRNHRRTLIMISATVVAVWAMIFMTALMRGMVNEMIRDGVESLPGHVQVHHPQFRDDPSIGNPVPMSDDAIIDALSGGDFPAWSSRIRVPAVITSERETRGVTLYGVDPVRDRDITFVADSIVAGRYLESSDDTGLVVGQRLLERLDTRLGKRVVIMSQDPDNEIADRGFRIVGVFTAKLEAQEESMVFAGKETIGALLGVDRQITEVAILGDDYRDVGGQRGSVG